jgi:hypothetical protein
LGREEEREIRLQYIEGEEREGHRGERVTADINSIDGIHGVSMREKKWGEREIWCRRFVSARQVPSAGHGARGRRTVRGLRASGCAAPGRGAGLGRGRLERRVGQSVGCRAWSRGRKAGREEAG